MCHAGNGVVRRDISRMSMNNIKRGLSRYHLKWIAAFCMVVDHVGVAFAVKGTMAYTVMRTCIGRIAFPIFCALLVDGFFRTKHPWRHVRDLALFALLSECVFDFVHTKGATWFYLGKQSVMLTWLIGYLMIIGLDFALDSPKVDKYARPPFCILIVLLAFCVAAGYSVDYNAIGVMCVLLCYIWKRNLKDNSELWPLVLVAAIGDAFSFNEMCALIAPLFAFFYDPELDKKASTPFQKYVFYAFYPAHLALISAAILIVDKFF